MIPKYHELMWPILQLASDGEIHSQQEAVEQVIQLFQLPKRDQMQLLESGRKRVIVSRAGWARTYLRQAGLVRFPKPGYFQITDRGTEVVQEHPEALNNEYLMRFDEFRAFKQRRRPVASTEAANGDETPQERLYQARDELENDTHRELLERLQQCDPGFFEKVVVDVLVGMGYGGTYADAAKVVGGPGDEGIDGVINQDPLGLDVIYVQAKRWKGDVRRRTVQEFVGALSGKHATKGVIITTSKFSKSAVEYVAKINSKVILIDGERLADLMLQHNIGVTVGETIQIKRLDTDYFED